MPPIRNARGRLTELPSAAAYDGTPLRPGTLVSVNSQRGPLPALLHRLFTDAHPRAHVQYLVPSFAGDRFLGPKCGNVSTRSILRTRPGEAAFVAEPGVWRDALPPGPHSPPGEKADPFAVTSCDACLVAQRARDAVPRVIHAIDGPDVFKIAGEEYHPGDLVFFESSERGAWTPGILSRSHRATPAGEEWGVRLCGRYTDLPVAFIDEVSHRIRS
jgi:hypothetical protein